MPTRSAGVFRLVATSLVLGCASTRAYAAEPGGAVPDLVEQNRRLQEQVGAQQRTIDDLTRKMAELLKTTERHEQELRGRRERDGGASTPEPSPNREHDVRVAGEAGLAFFRTGSAGQFPKSEFRADDPVLTIEAPVMKNTYVFTELKFPTREANAEDLTLGEIYVDFEDVSTLWGRPGWLSLRAGRLNIPFGEEYQHRSPVANPLISHSLSDIWGVDEGIEAYGRLGAARYVLAVQNGGDSRLHDYNADKAVAGRVSWEPAHWLSLSGSAMRTGELSTTGDSLSEVWFGGGFFRALGPAARTGRFWASLYEADASAHWKNGQLRAALGRANFDDSDPAADNARRMRYGYAEIMQGLVDRLYAAARYSQIRVARGYPLVGWGGLGSFFFRPSSLTEELKRISIGLGFRFAPPLVWKIEYTWESGRMLNGARRDDEDFFGSELGVRF